MMEGSALFWLLVTAVMVLSVAGRKLTVGGALAGGAVACCIYWGAGYPGIALLGAFFGMGIGATAWQRRKKESLGLAEGKGGLRHAGQVLANGGLAGLLGLAGWLLPGQASLCSLLMAAALASAAADTLSSELGNVYGRRYYNIRTLQPDSRGLDGVVSLEGTLLGLGGSLVIALVFAASHGWGRAVAWIVLAGTAGNLADSYLGATLERKRALNNDAVNFLNTVVAALAAWVLQAVFE